MRYTPVKKMHSRTAITTVASSPANNTSTTARSTSLCVNGVLPNAIPANDHQSLSSLRNDANTANTNLPVRWTVQEAVLCLCVLLLWALVIGAFLRKFADIRIPQPRELLKKFRPMNVDRIQVIASKDEDRAVIYKTLTPGMEEAIEQRLRRLDGHHHQKQPQQQQHQQQQHQQQQHHHQHHQRHSDTTAFTLVYNLDETAEHEKTAFGKVLNGERIAVAVTDKKPHRESSSEEVCSEVVQPDGHGRLDEFLGNPHIKLKSHSLDPYSAAVAAAAAARVHASDRKLCDDTGMSSASSSLSNFSATAVRQTHKQHHQRQHHVAQSSEILPTSATANNSESNRKMFVGGSFGQLLKLKRSRVAPDQQSDENITDILEMREMMPKPPYSSHETPSQDVYRGSSHSSHCSVLILPN